MRAHEFFEEMKTTSHLLPQRSRLPCGRTGEGREGGQDRGKAASSKNGRVSAAPRAAVGAPVAASTPDVVAQTHHELCGLARARGRDKGVPGACDQQRRARERVEVHGDEVSARRTDQEQGEKVEAPRHPPKRHVTILGSSTR